MSGLVATCIAWVASPDRAESDRGLRWLSLLDASELERYKRYRLARSKAEHLTAHALLRQALAATSGTSPTDFRFEPGSHGKPEIVAPPLPRRLEFNISHTRGLVACALAWERPLGIDVEHVDRKVDFVPLARRYFAAPEIAELEAREGEAKRRRFFELWTIKEAYLKARGAGLSLPLSSACISFHPVPRLAFAPALQDDPARWQVHLEHRGRHVLAIVAPSGTTFEVGDGAPLLDRAIEGPRT